MLKDKFNQAIIILKNQQIEILLKYNLLQLLTEVH